MPLLNICYAASVHTHTETDKYTRTQVVLKQAQNEK